MTMKLEKDKISILMGLYNAEKTIDESIKSILNQTYKNWELIICDDGSTDNGVDIVKEYLSKDNRIVLIRNNKNMGLNYTLNHCLKYATGEYIARMDADDISLPQRLQKEIETIKKENVEIVSTAMEFFDEGGTWGINKVIDRPTKKDFIYGTPFCHAPCLVKKTAILSVGGYTVKKRLLRVEDYHLWYKMYLRGYKGVNISEPLYKMRDDRNASNRRKLKYRFNESYVRYLIWKDFNYGIKDFILIFRPILVGLLPNLIYEKLHRKKLGVKI